MKEKWEDFKDWFHYYNEIFVYIIVIVIVIVLSYGAYIMFDPGVKKLEKKQLQPKVIVIDSCEYIKSGTKIIHKENCKYCTERKLNK